MLDLVRNQKKLIQSDKRITSSIFLNKIKKRNIFFINEIEWPNEHLSHRQISADRIYHEFEYVPLSGREHVVFTAF